MPWYKNADIIKLLRNHIEKETYTTQSLVELLAAHGYEGVKKNAVRAHLSRMGLSRTKLAVTPKLKLSEEEYVSEFDTENLELRELRNENRRLKKTLTNRTLFLQDLKSEFKVHSLSPTYYPLVTQKVTKGAFSDLLILSDVHVGQITRTTLGNYNIEEFVRRAQRLSQRLLDLYKHEVPDKLVLCLAGDLIDGRDIHKGHALTATDLATQLRVGPEVLSHIILSPLSMIIPEIIVEIVPGNHGRLGEKGALDIVGDSLDVVFAQGMQWLCSNLTNITWKFPVDWFQYWQLRGHSYFLSHGDTISGGLRGLEKNLSDVQTMLHAPLDVIITGHIHTPGNFDSGYSRVVSNSSWIGTGDFGVRIGKCSLPSQKLLRVTDESPVLFAMDIPLTDRKNIQRFEIQNLDT